MALLHLIQVSSTVAIWSRLVSLQGVSVRDGISAWMEPGPFAVAERYTPWWCFDELTQSVSCWQRQCRLELQQPCGVAEIGGLSQRMRGAFRASKAAPRGYIHWGLAAQGTAEILHRKRHSMLRFADESPHQLISSLFQLKIERDENQYEVFVRQLLPQGDPDEEMIKNIKLFSFPDPSSVEPHTFLTFSIGNAENLKIGFVLYSTAFDALCVLTDFYYPRLFKAMMKLPYLEMAAIALELFKVETRRSVTIKGTEFPLDGALERQRAMSLLFKTFAPYDISKIVIGIM